MTYHLITYCSEFVRDSDKQIVPFASRQTFFFLFLVALHLHFITNVEIFFDTNSEFLPSFLRFFETLPSKGVIRFVILFQVDIHDKHNREFDGHSFYDRLLQSVCQWTLCVYISHIVAYLTSYVCIRMVNLYLYNRERATADILLLDVLAS